MPKTLSQPANLLHTIMLYKSKLDMYGCPEDFNDEDNTEEEIEDLDLLLEEYSRSNNSSRKGGKPAAKAAPKLKERLDACISSLRQHKNLASYQLSENDVMVAAFLWGQSEKPFGHDWDDILSWCEINNHDLIGNLEYLGSLLERNIIVNVETNAAGHQLDPYNLMQGSFKLHSKFRQDLQHEDPRQQIEASLHPTWNTKREMDRDLILFRNLLTLSYPEFNERLNKNTHRCHRALIDKLMKPLQKRIKTADRNIPLIGYIDAHQPTDTDLIVLLWTYTDHLVQDNSPICLLANLLSRDYDERLQMEANLMFSASLHELGLRYNMRGPFWDMREMNYMVLCKRVLSDLHLHDEESDEDLPDISGNLIELKATQSFDDLILPAGDKNLMAATIRRYKQGEKADLSDWGLVAASSGDSGKKGKGTCFLLYGAPGTGKTFAAGAIANALGKKLMAIDASSLRDKYYGNSQKIVRRTFAAMRKLVEGSDNPPVFLLNEADQIIHRRSIIEKSCGEVENAIQNIFLEELEDFPGIIILTTNLVDNIDDAYFRRFDVKLEFHRPDYECRLKLWKLHLPESIPGAAEIDCEYMARAFDLSGGQISLVVRNACSEAITRSGNERRLTQDDLVRYAREEDPWSCPGGCKRRIGFCA
ncbi:MAG: Proteasome-associated ATPase [Candidatus Cloacimonetes bacterium ADurb.Bin088]|jgi:hypothetical protein|nr:MAG: Proteasome-associated ATPase [Candidatus Cloacimonetes bacterium ADurb.Bin088]